MSHPRRLGLPAVAPKEVGKKPALTSHSNNAAFQHSTSSSSSSTLPTIPAAKPDISHIENQLAKLEKKITEIIAKRSAREQSCEQRVKQSRQFQKYSNDIAEVKAQLMGKEDVDLQLGLDIEKMAQVDFFDNEMKKFYESAAEKDMRLKEEGEMAKLQSQIEALTIQKMLLVNPPPANRGALTSAPVMFPAITANNARAAPELKDEALMAQLRELVEEEAEILLTGLRDVTHAQSKRNQIVTTSSDQIKVNEDLLSREQNELKREDLRSEIEELKIEQTKMLKEQDKKISRLQSTGGLRSHDKDRLTKISEEFHQVMQEIISLNETLEMGKARLYKLRDEIVQNLLQEKDVRYHFGEDALSELKKKADAYDEIIAAKKSIMPKKEDEKAALTSVIKMQGINKQKVLGQMQHRLNNLVDGEKNVRWYEQERLAFIDRRIKQLFKTYYLKGPSVAPQRR